MGYGLQSPLKESLVKMKLKFVFTDGKDKVEINILERYIYC
jgi:hypothetical protein